MERKKGRCTRGIYNSQRGQITIFIIVGVLMLFLFAAVLYLVKTTKEAPLLAEEEPVLATVPSEFQPLTIYTENCLQQVGKRGLVILGQQGGYIYPDLVGEYSSTQPSEADGLLLESLKVPYWNFNDNPNSALQVKLRSSQPRLYAREDAEMSIESQLSRFVEEKIDECLQNYLPFEAQGFRTEVDPVRKVQVRVGEQAISFLLTQEITATRAETEHLFEQFYVKVPLRLKHAYEIAAQITQEEQNSSFLEWHGLQLIHLFSGTNREQLPPTSATTFDDIPQLFWTASNVKKDFKDLLSSYLPMLRYQGSQNFFRYQYPLSAQDSLYQKTSDNMILPLFGAEDLEVNFDYLGWDPYVHVNVGEDVLQPANYAVQFWMLRFAFQNYYNSYDASYPVLVSLRDSSAFDGEGYNFVFALESNIRNNRPAKSGEEIAPPQVRKKSLVCDKETWDTEPVKSIVIDSSTKEPLEAVSIGFTIPNQGDCLVGQTDAGGELSSSLPPVYGGVLNYGKEGYLTNLYPLDSYEAKDNPLLIGYAVADLPSEISAEKVIEMHPLQQVKIKVKKKKLSKCVKDDCYGSGVFSSSGEQVYSFIPAPHEVPHRWIFSSSAQNLNANETATLSLERVSNTNPAVANLDFAAAATLRGTEMANLSLYPGIYRVRGFLTDEREVLIPAEERCTGGLMEAISCFDVEGCCFDFDEVKLPKYLTGQITWDTPESYLTITPEQLYGAQEITFYLPAQDLQSVPAEPGKRVIEDLQLAGNVSGISKMASVREALEPKWN